MRIMLSLTVRSQDLFSPFLRWNFEIIVDSHAAERNNTERVCVQLTSFLTGSICTTIVQYHNQVFILIKSTDHIQISLSILYFLKFSFILAVYLLGHGIYQYITSPPHPHLGVSNMESYQVLVLLTKCSLPDVQIVC